MTESDSIILSVINEHDVVSVRQRVRECAIKQGLSTLDQTKLMTAASELARNIILYAGTGEVTVKQVADGLKRGVQVIFNDTGPGIPNIAQCRQDGFSTGRSLGIGLPGAKRLVNFFDIQSKEGHGTTITIIRWGK